MRNITTTTTVKLIKLAGAKIVLVNRILATAVAMGLSALSTAVCTVL